MADSAALIAYESGYPRVIEGWHVSMLDNFTDTVMLLTAIGEEPDAGILVQAADAPRPLYTGGSWLINHIDALAKDGMPQDAPQTTYPRYWHGYLAVLKPVLLAFDYPQIRILNMIVQAFVLLAVTVLMLRRAGITYTVALTAGILCLTPVAIPLSMQFSTCCYVMLGALLFLLRRYEWLQQKDRGALFFCFIGIVTNYFDLLTYPIVTLGVPLTVYLLLQENATIKSSLRTAIVCCAFWGAGYAAMWVSKWALATLITGNNVFADALFSVQERTSLTGGGELGAGDITRLSTIKALVGMLKRRPYLLMAAGIVTGCAYLVLRGRLAVKATPQAVHVPSFIGIAALPLLWYAVMPNHSYTHYFYTFRGLSVTVFALLSCLFAFLRTRTPEGAPPRTGAAEQR